MKPRTTLILAAVLIVIVGIAALMQSRAKKSLSPKGNQIFASFSKEAADGIQIDGKGKQVELRKQDGTWMVDEHGWHKADPKAANQILDAMDGFNTTTLVSTSPEKQSSFEVDSTGITVHILQGDKTLASFVVGKPGPDYMSTYIRPADQSKVYQIPTYLRSMVDRGDQTWRDLMVLDLKEDEVLSFSARNPKMDLAAEKDASGAWKITEPFTANAKPDMMSLLMRSLLQFRASGFADSTITPETAGLIPDTTRIEIKTSDGSTHVLDVGAMNDKRQSYVQKEGDPTIYLVPRGRINTIFRDPQTLKAEEAPPSASTEEGAAGGSTSGTPMAMPPVPAPPTPPPSKAGGN